MGVNLFQYKTSFEMNLSVGHTTYSESFLYAPYRFSLKNLGESERMCNFAAENHSNRPTTYGKNHSYNTI